jgi:tetratricopeptide (TPR) repeat protein
MTLASTLTTIETIESAGLVQLAQAVPELVYLFRHAMVQEAAYASLLRQDRKQLHAKVGEALERAHQAHPEEHAALLAHHFWNAGVWDKSAAYSIMAGEAALRAYANREAMSHYDRARQALKEMHDTLGEQVVDSLLGWARAAYHYRPYPEQLERLQEAEAKARSLNDRRRLAQVLYSIGNVYRASGHNLSAEQPLAECYTLADQLGDEALTVIPTYNMGMLIMESDPHRALELFDQTIRLARRYDNMEMEAYALSSRGMVRARLGEASRAMQDLDEALRAVNATTSLMTKSDVDLFASTAFLDLGDTERSLDYSRRGIDEAKAADNIECVCYGFACVGFGHLQAKQLPEAAAAFEESIWRSQYAGAQLIESMSRSGLAITHLYAGLPGASHEAEAAVAETEQAGILSMAAMLRLALAEVYATSGDLDRALAYVNVAADYYRRTQIYPYLARTLQSAAALYERRGMHAEASAARAEATTVMQAVREP